MYRNHTDMTAGYRRIFENNSMRHTGMFFFISIILQYDQQMYNYFTNYHTATCFDTIVSPSDSL